MALPLDKYKNPVKRLLVAIYIIAIWRFREFRAYLAYYFLPEPKNQKKVLIYAQGRTGSTLLESLLSSNNSFLPHGELLTTAYIEPFFPMKLLLGTAKRDPENFICHVKIHHLTKDRKRPVDAPKFIKTLHQKGWKIVFLRRENKAKHVISNMVATRKGQYHQFSEQKEAFRMNFDCAEFGRSMQLRFNRTEDEEAAISGIDHLPIAYETHLENSEKHQDTANLIYDYVGMKRQTVKTRHKKINAVGLKELISNYDEFLNCLQQNDWLHYLTEEERQN